MDRIKFKVNGEEYSVGCEVSSDMMLVDYLRDVLKLSGTKYMCREGGCGTCCVSVRKCATGPLLVVNSCMISITSCQDWEVTTIEEIGNRKTGYSILQKTLAEHNGSQCGYCSPAWVQNMYSLLQNGQRHTMLEIEKSFAGNICRCTGYRPILEAFKTFASDAPQSRIKDIEDLQICKKTGLSCLKKQCDDDSDWCIISDEEVNESRVLKVKLEDNKYWYKVYDLKSIFEILNERGYDSYMFVYGNTAKGAYPINDYPKVLIDISSVPELKRCNVDQNLIVGVGITINELLDVFKSTAKDCYFEYLNKFVEHIELVANIPIRNLGSVGGNLMIKHQHHEFVSDIFLLFETVGAYLSILTSKGVSKKLSMKEFLDENMKGKIIVDFMLPPFNERHKLETYKIMPRSQNAHAIVHAGFLYELSSDNIVVSARLAYGGLSPDFIRAEATEKFLIGKYLFSNNTLQAALRILECELVVVENPPEPSVRYRKQLALSLFYKGLLSLCPKDILDSRFVSGSTKIHETRPVSEGKQVFTTDPSLWPLNQPINKIDGLIQCAGESKYTDDLPTQPREVYAAFVLSTVSVGDIDEIDASTAMKQPRVIAFYTADDVPGVNAFTPANQPFYVNAEEFLCNGRVKYFNQPISVIVAETKQIAEKAAKMVKITYKDVQNPIVDVRVAKHDKNRVTLFSSNTATDKGTDVVKTINGEATIFGQIHFMMEHISCVALPTEEGMKVHLASQWINGAQIMISRALNINANCVDVCVNRIGGGFGLKISRSFQSAIACALTVQNLNRPCRLVLPLTTYTRAIGKRLPCHTEYECKVNAIGVIQSIRYKQYEDNGYDIGEKLSILSAEGFNNCYPKSKWDFELYDVVTDTAKNTWCRAPGSLESISLTEHVVERISYELSLDPFDVRLANVDCDNYSDLIEMAKDLKRSASYTERKEQVAIFNRNNCWRKRGLRVSFLRWSPVGYSVFYINLCVCNSDGTVVITHGGVEIGQGIDTRAVQICAYLLKIPIDQIQIKANDTIISPNCYTTGGSIASHNVGLGVKRCCEELLKRLEPIRCKMNNPTWAELIAQAYLDDVDLQTHSYVGAKDALHYDVFGIALAETEVDGLTGEFEILRVDILQDVGQSVSPEIDIGQVEGAFIMGLGYWTCENLVYNDTTGELLTDRTWNYNVPMARDIPQDFRVTFRNNSYSVPQIFGAKGVGEPPMCLAVVIPFALREAIVEFRKDIGIPSKTWFNIDGPLTVEKINLACKLRIEDFKYNCHVES